MHLPYEIAAELKEIFGEFRRRPLAGTGVAGGFILACYGSYEAISELAAAPLWASTLLGIAAAVTLLVPWFAFSTRWRTAKLYPIPERRNSIDLLRSYDVAIRRGAPSTLTHYQKVVFLAEPKPEDLCAVVQATPYLDLSEIRYRSSVGNVAVERVSDSTAKIVVSAPQSRLKLAIWELTYSWSSNHWGGRWDNIFVPIDKPTGEVRVQISSEFALDRVVACKLPDSMRAEDNEVVAKFARFVQDPEAPLPQWDRRTATWTMELPEVGQMYCVTVFYSQSAPA